jgi:hypothetical protein
MVLASSHVALERAVDSRLLRVTIIYCKLACSQNAWGRPSHSRPQFQKKPGLRATRGLSALPLFPTLLLPHLLVAASRAHSEPNPSFAAIRRSVYKASMLSTNAIPFWLILFESTVIQGGCSMNYSAPSNSGKGGRGQHLRGDTPKCPDVYSVCKL